MTIRATEAGPELVPLGNPRPIRVTRSRWYDRARWWWTCRWCELGSHRVPLWWFLSFGFADDPATAADAGRKHIEQHRRTALQSDYVKAN